ncbi:MAG TPA: ATP-binding protein [Mucilaginibacter sp.]|nr:ATP-binding protein [Mucilaginibacter sp.]
MGQRNYIDSLKQTLKNASTDSARYSILGHFVYYYAETNRDSALSYIEKGLFVAKRNGHLLDEAVCLGAKGYISMHLGKYSEAYRYFRQEIAIAEDPKNEKKSWYFFWPTHEVIASDKFRLTVEAFSYHNMGLLMNFIDNTDEQIIQFKKAEKLATQLQNLELLGLVNMNLGSLYLEHNKVDSSLQFQKKAERYFNQIANKKYLCYDLEILGITYLRKGQEGMALEYFHKGAAAGFEYNAIECSGYCYDDLAHYYLSKKQKDSSLYYAKKIVGILHSMNSKDLGNAYEVLYQSYRLRNQLDSSYKYQGLALSAKDSSYDAIIKNLTNFQKSSFTDQLRLQQLEKEKAVITARNRIYMLSAGIAVFMLLALIFYRNNRQKQRANILLNRQKEEVQNALTQLKETQTQLIQSEKMASLGELTAGIAHEIQNPLNFVNNFSEVNTELIGEMKEEIEKGDLQEIKAIAFDIEENSKKINMHGKRADGIVKSMLQHSQAASGGKEQADTNQLAEECLQLAYNGFKSKDKSFTCDLKTNFDRGLPLTNVVKRDIGRALVNIFNNAFYALAQKAKEKGEIYTPLVIITTLQEKDKIIIKITDNGVGMPAHIKEKIMHPFFTTKPTGEGTGLGLSLTHDIIVKGHSGSIDVKSVDGEGSEFIISLPC